MLTDERDNWVDAVKGLLILCVIVGHSLFSNTLIPDLKTVLYSFHVYCFLLLPFLFHCPRLSLGTVEDVVVRYFVPYATIVLIFSLVRLLFVNEPFRDWILNYIKAVLTGNDNYLRAASGFSLFWFMPVILLVNLIKIIYYNQTRHVRNVLLVLFICTHLLLPALPWETKKYYPGFGSHVALYIAVLGILTWFLWGILGRRTIRKMRYLLVIVFLCLVALMLRLRSEVSLGHLGCPSYHTPFLILLHDLIPLTALFTFIGFSDTLARIPFLPIAGRRTLQIYLLHPVFVYGVDAAYHRQSFLADSVASQIGVGLVSVICGVIGPMVIAGAIDSMPGIRRMLFPRSANEFLNWSRGQVSAIATK